MFVASSAIDEEASKKRSRNKTCINERFEVYVSVSSKRLGGVLEAAWRHLKASWRRHDEAEMLLMV